MESFPQTSLNFEAELSLASEEEEAAAGGSGSRCLVAVQMSSGVDV